MIQRKIGRICYADLRGTARSFAYGVRGIAAGLWKFLRFGNSHDDSCGNRFGLDVSVAPQHMHPSLKRAAIESGLFLDFAIADGRTAENPTDLALLMRLPKYKPPVEPHRRAHALVMTRFEQHSAQPGVVILASHRLPRNERPCVGSPESRSCERGILVGIASALATIRNAHFHVAARSEIANFQASHPHHRRQLSAETAQERRMLFCHGHWITECATQLALVMPALAVRAFSREMCGIGAPCAHVEAVIPTTFLEKHASQLCGICEVPRTVGRKTISVHRFPPDVPLRIHGAAIPRVDRTRTATRTATGVPLR